MYYYNPKIRNEVLLLLAKKSSKTFSNKNYLGASKMYRKKCQHIRKSRSRRNNSLPVEFIPMLMCAKAGACALKYSEDDSNTYSNFMPNEQQMGQKNETLIKTDCNQTVGTVEYHSLSTDKKYGSSRNASDESIESEKLLSNKDYEEKENW